MTSPRWARALLRFVAPPHREDDVLGDLEEAHRARLAESGRVRAWLTTSVETLDVGTRLLLDRVRHTGSPPRRPEEAAKEDVFSGFGVSWLDFKLGFRMLVRFPALTVVASMALAFAIALGVGTYEFFEKVTDPAMPFEDGDRIVNLWNQDLETGSHEPRALHDFVTWRDELDAFEKVGAWHSFQRNLATQRGVSVPRLGAAVTADLLAIPRVPPMLGRLISRADEVPGAPDVVVLGYDVWRTQFGADPNVVGERVHLGSTPATVVGVMPDGFGWPRSYQVWTPMRLDPLDYERGESPMVEVGARLSPGVISTEAEAELATLGARAAADFPETHGHLRPRMTSFGAIELPVSGVTWSLFYSLSVLAFGGLLVLVCGNVALLLFARTAARESEIVVRSALGASRGRIVAQLFVEALLLGGLASLMGLWGAQAGLRWVVRVMESMGEGQFGFWFHEPISSRTQMIAVSLTLSAAALSGAVPALKVTGTALGAHLKRAGSSSGQEFGRLWSTVIVTQIAVTVAFVPLVLFLAYETSQIRTATYGFPAEEYLSVELAMGGRSVTMVELSYARGGAADADLDATARELERRLLEEPGVRSVTLASQVPGAYHPRRVIEIDGPTTPPSSGTGHRVSWTAVDPDFFDALETEMVAGRGFDASDMDRAGNDDPLVAIVNEDFVRHLLEDRNPIGRRFRFRDPSWREGEPMRMGPWHEIVGVVEQIAMTIDPEMEEVPGYYVPLATSGADPLRIVARVGRDPGRLVPRIRELAAQVSRDLLITDIRPLDDSAWQARKTYESWFWVVLGAGGVGVLLATVGIYSIMAFTVTRRTREIGVRVALGADHGRVLWGIFSRALSQIGVGIVIGGTLLALLVTFLASEGSAVLTPSTAGLFVGYLALMSAVCGLACVVPTRRALAVEPTEALRAEG